MSSELKSEEVPWYSGITRYQWLVLLIASLGWVFDIFEGQIFVASMNEAMPSLAPDAQPGDIRFYNTVALGGFLLGGALGGILFGMLSDRIGRKKTMSLTILFYSLFTFVSAFSQAWWHMVIFRFLVAMGVGGEWAVASALVAEVFPKRARAHVGGIFHASSVFGTYLAVITGWVLIGNAQLAAIAEAQAMPSLPWRIGFAIGVLPALLIIWIRSRLVEPESWVKARDRSASDRSQEMGRISDLFSAEHRRNTTVGVTLAAVGLATFWGAHIYGKDLLRKNYEQRYAAGVTEQLAEQLTSGADAKFDLTSVENDNLNREAVLADVRAKLQDGEFNEYAQSFKKEDKSSEAKLVGLVQAELKALNKRWEMLGMFLVTTGGGIGLVLFGPISQRTGRRVAFIVYHVAGCIAAVGIFWPSTLVMNPTLLMIILPVFGFVTLGMHAGYAIYFPELYPTRLRGTGTGFCFNAGRILAAPILFIMGWAQRPQAEGVEFSIQSFFLGQNGLGLELVEACWYVSWLYVLGVIVVIWAKETRGQELPE